MRVYAAALTRHCHLLWGLHGHDPLGAPPSYNGRCDACTHFTDEGGRSRELISPAPELARGGMGTQAQPQAEDHALRVAAHLCVCAGSLSHVPLSATLRTIAHQAPLPMGFPKQEYWSGFPFHSPGDLPNPGIEPASPVSLALADRFFTTEPPGKPF